MRREEKRGAFASPLTSLRLFVFDEKSSIIAGGVRRSLREKGLDIEIRDLFIAAICMANQLPLLTNNKKHFERFQEFGLVLL
ncbi:type II toxin-antitoxin system VapC family toxin [Candidatus Woesearchaeota archaeon]|nr:type II toxin-antitoxin system VapC family toxin [Candidatus Woesearchaeota archaeon]